MAPSNNNNNRETNRQRQPETTAATSNPTDNRQQPQQSLWSPQNNPDNFNQRSDHSELNDSQKQKVREVDARMQQNGYLQDDDREWLRSNGFRDDEIDGGIWRSLSWWSWF